MTIQCERCGIDIRSYSPMRKWCVDCRRVLANERLKLRNKTNKH